VYTIRAAESQNENAVGSDGASFTSTPAHRKRRLMTLNDNDHNFSYETEKENARLLTVASRRQGDACKSGGQETTPLWKTEYSN